ncbi:MAG: tryptophan synthase subunit beta like protein [Deltaproteobacteria bacterium]|nr:MAG: tryptophan synthase subunit beta like protein [Deltaproteobacteria bacterium]
MPYVKRDSEGRIAAISLDEQAGFEPCDNSDELETFCASLRTESSELAATDLPLVRVLEDLIHLLIDKQVIRFTDLPAPAQQKLLERRNLRTSLKNSLQLLQDDQQGIL